MSSRTGLVLEEKFCDHMLQTGHPESPQRLRAILQRLNDVGLMEECTQIAPLTDVHMVEHAVGEVHSAAHADSVCACDTTGEVAMLAAGGVLAAVKAVMDGEITNAFCAIRPPGHHAHNNGAHRDGACQGEGFCFINNVAVAARYAQRECGCERVAILDWDFHHGNGTEWAFYDDPSVFFFSTHALYAYPGTGYASRKGARKGAGYNLNVPLDFYSGDEEIVEAWEGKLLPALERLTFKPDIVLISAGFDSREKDYLGNFRVTDAGFARLTRIAMDIAEAHCGGRLVSVLEGGYNPEGLAKAVTAHMETMAG